MMITGEQIKQAMIENEITYADHHECGICGVMVYYRRDGDNLYFHPGCACLDHGIEEPRTWDSVADWINMQTNEDSALKMMSRFGLNTP